MEEQNDNHSDSDSGESWTLLEASPSYATDDSPQHFQVSAGTGIVDDAEKDEDTDGISIISECESEPPYEHIQKDVPIEAAEDVMDFLCLTKDEVTAEPDDRNMYDEMLGDSSKLKTYVHKRNNKVSSMLNVILLGSVITAAGIALGHIWGVRDDCPQQKPPSVNKILSNLYKLQEENEFLRGKLKELTLATHMQSQQKKSVQKPNNKCRKIFEEPLTNVNIVKTTKCIDPDLDARRPIVTELSLPFDSINDGIYESEVNGEEFKNDVKKLKNFYKENKKWLDKEIAKRLKFEKRYNQDKFERVILRERQKREMNSVKDVDADIDIDANDTSIEAKKQEIKPNIISYADSLKSPHVIKYHDDDIFPMSEERKSKTNRLNKKKLQKQFEKIETDFSEDEDIAPTDKRRHPNKYKSDKHRNDRRSRYKKEKRENKYQQWEMKGGYLKDYDSIASMTSEDIPTDINNNRMSPEWEMYVTYVNKNDKKKKQTKEEEPTDFFIVNKAIEDLEPNIMQQSLEESVDESWFERRTSSRRHARELEKNFPSNIKFKTNSRWYFRRMSDREKLRMSVDNNTRPKSHRRNYKTRR